MPWLEDLSTPSKQTIVLLALAAIIFLKIYGFIQTKPTWILIISLAIVASITEAKPLNQN